MGLLAVRWGSVAFTTEVKHEERDAHHDDYAKPLEVRWLCKKHHGSLR